MKTWTIQSRYVRAEIQSLGAMLGPAWFYVGDSHIQPFAVAPWSGQSGAEYDRLPRVLRRLRGEWPCVPFGIERALENLPEEWCAPKLVTEWPRPDSHPHGLSANADWELAAHTGDRIDLFLNCPAPYPVRLLRRTIQASAIAAKLEIRLQIEARSSCALPLGLHATFSLPTGPRKAALSFGSTPQAWTSPVPLEPDLPRFRSDVRAVPLDRIPLITGSEEDITRLPLPYPAEEIVLVTNHSGYATLSDLDGLYTVKITWDPRVFPACQVWLSNYGRRRHPWNGRFLAVGIEPVCAAFDLGVDISSNRRNPLWRAGIPSTCTLSAARSFETNYAIEVAGNVL